MRSLNDTEYVEGDYPEPSHSAHELAPRPIEACETLRISEDAQNSLQQLQDINDRHHSVFSVLLSALVVLLSRLTGDEDIAIGTSHENQIPFVLRIAIDPKTSFSKLLTDVEKVSIISSDHILSTSLICDFA